MQNGCKLSRIIQNRADFTVKCVDVIGSSRGSNWKRLEKNTLVSLIMTSGSLESFQYETSYLHNPKSIRHLASWMSCVMLTSMFLCQMSLVDLGKRLLEAARKGQDDEVRNLMANGAPFTTDWVRHVCDRLTDWLMCVIKVKWSLLWHLCLAWLKCFSIRSNKRCYLGLKQIKQFDFLYLVGRTSHHTAAFRLVLFVSQRKTASSTFTQF